MERILRFLKKLKTELLPDPAIPLLGIYPVQMETGHRTGICTLILQHYSQ